MAEDLERFDPAVQKGRIAYEHLHRYALCREWVEGLQVLDLACGAGYGTAILGSAAAAVTGVDIDRDSVIEARRRYGRGSISYVEADCFHLPFADGSFDAVVANEMIEHVADQNALLAEVKRVLRPGGRLLVSTPNRPVYNRFQPPNPFHVAELDVNEFESLLRGHFPHVQLVGTRMLLSSVSFDLQAKSDGANQANARLYTAPIGVAGPIRIENALFEPADPEYVLAACSTEPLPEVFPANSLFFSAQDDLWLEHQRIMAWASGLHDEDEILRRDLRTVQEGAAAAAERLAEVENQHADGVRQLAESRAQVEQLSIGRSAIAEEAQRAADRSWAPIAGYVELIAGTALGTAVPEVMRGLFQINERKHELERSLALQEDRAGRKDAALEAADNALSEARKEIARLAAAHEHATALLEDARNTSTAALTEAHDKIGRLQETAATVGRQAQQAQNDHAAARQVIEELSHLREKLIAELAVATERAEAVEARAEASEQSLTKAGQELEALRRDRQQAERRAAAAETLLETARARLDRGSKDLQSVQTRLNEATADRETTSVALQKAEDHAATLDARIDQIRSKLRQVFPERRPLSARENLSRGEFRKQHRSVRDALKAAASAIDHAALLSVDQQPGSSLTDWLPFGARLDSCLFDRSWILRNHPDLTTINLRSYLRNPRYWAIDPHPLFDARYYQSQQTSQIAGRDVAPLRHYVERGWREGRDPHPWFSNDWYLQQNPDVLADGTINPLDHYLLHGWREGRAPNPVFNPEAYLERYPDVRAEGMEPLTHFVIHGLAEGREVPIRGATPNTRLWVPERERNRPLMEFMLACDVPEDAPQIDIEALLASSPGSERQRPVTSVVTETGPSWPPKPLNDFWPPQGLRNFVLDRYSEEVLDRIWFLYSVMNAFEDNAESFPTSDVCNQLVRHARDRATNLALAAGQVPDVSIVIPVYNNILDTMLCVVSILDAETLHSFEIIVADDCSTDATAELIPSIGGCVRHVRHATNHGFLGNCNAAAEHARGRCVLLLNNDTLVMPHWLDALLEPFDRMDRVGLTGAKLINWDGTLQEAGGIYWNDGSAWNFGRNQAPRAPQFSYLKDVDYISGAAICLPRDVWKEMGGFDPLFSPAYCEDSDIAFRLREAGYRTLLTPDAEVIHHEGRSHGRDVASGIKAYQVTNSQRLFERWQTVLERDHYPNAVNVLRARDRSFAKKHVLVIDHYVPQWDQDAGSRSTFNCIQALIARGYSITLWPDNLWRDPDYTPTYQSMGVEVIYGGEYQGGFTTFIRERSDLYDAAFVNRPHIAEPYIDALRANTDAVIMFYGHDLHFQRMTRAMEIGEDVTAEAIDAAREQELRVCSKADVVFYPDQSEVDYVARTVGGNRRFCALPVVVYPQDRIMEPHRRSTTAERVPQLLFVGGFNHQPNRDGIIWFVKEVLPLVERQVGSLHLKIVGSKPPAEVTSLGSDGITVTGFVSDDELFDLYDEATLCVAPLRYGAGVKGKVIEALARGVPLATTPVGAQGLPDPERLLFMGDGASGLADAIVTALRDEEEALRRAKAGTQFIRQHYSFEALQVLFADLLEK